MKSEKKRTLYGIIAALTCPCHLFILGALAAGSVFGGVVNTYFIPLALLLTAIFLIALYKAFR